MGATLARREHSVVDALLEVLRFVRIPLEEDEAGTGATERLVRRGRDDVAVLEGVRELASGDETARVCDIGHEVRAVLVRDRAEGLVVPVTRVRGCTADEETGLVNLRKPGDTLVVDQLGRGVEAVRERLEVEEGD